MSIDLAQLSRPTLGRWCRSLLLALTLTACVGGGGEDSGTTPAPVASGPATISSLSSTVRLADGSEIANANPTVGDSVIFRVSASGSEPLRYQWYRNGVAIDGATGASYSIAQLSSDDDGAMFSVRVSNAENSAGTLSTILPLTVRWASNVELLAGGMGGAGSANGVGAAARFNTPMGVANDANGNIYVVEQFNYAVRKMMPDGVVTTVAGEMNQQGTSDGPAGTARFWRPRAISSSKNGTLYVVEPEVFTVRKVSPSGEVTTIAGKANMRGSNDGPAADARLYAPRAITNDESGNAYLVDACAIRKISNSGQVTTLAGSTDQCGHKDGRGNEALFYFLKEIAVDASGNLFVLEDGSLTQYIRKITPDGVVTTTTLGAGFINPDSKITVDTAGNLYLADGFNRTVHKVATNGLVSPLVDSVGMSGNADETSVIALKNNGIQGISSDANGQLYVADTDHHVIRKISPNGTVSTLAGKAPQSGNIDANGAAARFAIGHFPAGITSDAAGNVYQADTHNHTIRKISPSGVVTTLAGAAGQAGYADGQGAAARFYYPKGITVDAGGNLYVADHWNLSIRKITPAGLVTTVAGHPGNLGSATSQDNGNGQAAGFELPSAITIDKLGNLYVADKAAVRKITVDGKVTTLASEPTHHLTALRGITLDTQGNVYVTQALTNAAPELPSQNNIYKITPAGVLSALPLSAPLHTPDGIVCDAAGNLYVADIGNHTVRKITPSGVVSTIAGQAGIASTTLGALPGTLNRPGGIALVNRADGPALVISTGEANVLSIKLP